jgi:hypothetical protein
MPLSYLDSAGGADVGSEIVDPLSNQPAGFTTNDAVWDSDMSRMMAVGTDGVDVTMYSLDPTTLAWTQRDNYGTPLYGVDFDAGTDQFVMVGGSVSPIAYVGYNYPGSLSCPVPPVQVPAGTVYKDVAVFGANMFVAVTNNGRAFYHRYSTTWTWSEITGVFPATVNTTSCFYDANNSVVYILGEYWGSGRIYVIYTSDLLIDKYYAYNITGVSGQPPLRCGDWSQTAGYGIIAGDGQIKKMYAQKLMNTWREVGVPMPKPFERRYLAMTYMMDTGRILLFGGSNASIQYLDETWEYNVYNAKWTKINSAMKPSGRYFTSMAWDAARLRVVLYGGYRAGYLQDTWEYNPATYTWANRSGTSTYGTVAYHAMTWCDYYGQVVMSGGVSGSAKNTMGRWDGNTATWTTWVPSGAVAVYAHTIAYDDDIQRIVQFGGASYTSSTYLFSPAVNSWTLVSTPTGTPSARYYHNSVYDPFRNAVLIYGGHMSSIAKNDIWSFDFVGSRWIQVAQTSLGLAYAGMAIDNLGDIYVTGGYNWTTFYNNRLWKYGRHLSLDGTTTIATNSFIQARGVDWYPAANEAIIAGRGNKGYIWRHTRATSTITNVTNTVFPAANYNAVACKAPTGPGFAIVLGDPSSGVRINDIAGSSAVELDLAGPAISYVVFNTTSTNLPMLNRQVDVDSGSGSTTYMFQVGVGNPSGVAGTLSVDVYAWYDLGVINFDRQVAMGASFDSAGAENLRMHFRWTRGGAPSEWTQLYPSLPDEETTLVEGLCQRVDAGLNTTLTFAISPHQQVRYAPGNGGAMPFVQSPGSRYPGDRATTAALDSPNSWDFKVVLTTLSGNVQSFDEFGFYKYTYLSSSGLPGSLSGSGAPMTTVSLAPVGHVTFCSNCNYRLSTYVDADFTGDLGGTFSATNMDVMGGDVAWQDITGVGSAFPVYILGTAAIYHTPSDSGRTTTTEVGHPGSGAMQWRCYLPSVAQDTYRTSITYLLQNQP